VNLRSLVEGAALRGLIALPAPVQRALSGGVTVVDGQTLAPDVQLLIRVQNLARRETEEESIEVVRASMKRDAAVVGGTQPIGATREITVAGRPARQYLPSAPLVPVGEPGPLLVFVHGGGFIEGDIDTHDAPCRILAELSGVPVVSVTYRLGPEDGLPAAHDDAYACFRDIHERAAELGADPDRIAVGGDSAGGNLAAWVAIAAARDGLPVAFQLLIYPCVDGRRPRPGDSERLFSQGYYLTAEFMHRADVSYGRTPEALMDERMSPIDAELPEGLAPAYICTAGFDPLRDEGEAYAKRLSAAGHKVELERFGNQIHGFINMLVMPSCRAATGAVAARLRTAMTV